MNPIKPLLCAALLAACIPAVAHETHPRTAMTTAQTHTVESRYSFAQTVQRLHTAVTERGMTVFAVIDHQAAAQKDGLSMQPATVIVFGTPKAGTPLMVKDPAFALQLPLRVLVTETDGKVQVVYPSTRALIQNSHIDYADVENTLAKAETLIRNTVTQ
jgi:putative periplasmic protein